MREAKGDGLREMLLIAPTFCFVFCVLCILCLLLIGICWFEQEDEIITLINREAEGLYSSIQRDETARDRARVLEITGWFNFEKLEINQGLDDA